MLKLNKRIILSREMTMKANLTGLFEREDLDAIGSMVYQGYVKDEYSRSGWRRRMEAALDLALQAVKAKSFPWPNCSNIAFPLVTIASLQFHSQAYPAIFQGADLVKYRTTGQDPTGEKKARGDKISAHMSYQLVHEDESWEEQHDRLLLSVPIVGCAFAKTYYRPMERSNVSELVLAQDLVVDYYAKSIETARRKTQIIPLYRNEIYESCLSGVFCDVTGEAWYQGDAPVDGDEHTQAVDSREGVTPPTSDSETPFKSLEQHCWLDLDGDGYSEPYTVTIEESSQAVLRIVSRFEWDDVDRLSNGKIIKIRPTEYYTKYGFIPSPDGAIYDLGFGILLGPLNEATNSIINQLVDSGTMSNAAGGFITRGAKMRGGQYTFSPFEYKTVETSGDDLRKSIFPLPVREPSNVLLQLLSLLINYTGRVAGTTETQVGENPGQNTPAQTTQTMVEQGMKVYKAIYKRIWRSMKGELAKLYIQNSKYLSDAPITFGDSGMTIQRKDYLDAPPKNVMPASDPNVVSEQMRFQIAAMVKQAAMTTAGYDKEEVERDWLKALHVEGIDRLFPGMQKTGPIPNPKVQVEEMKLKAKEAELKFQQMKFVAELQEERQLNQAKILELRAKAAKEMEEAGGVKTGHQIAAFDAAVGAMKAHNDNISRQIELMMKGMENEQTRQDANGGGVQRMAGASGNEASSSSSPPVAGAA